MEHKTPNNKMTGGGAHAKGKPPKPTTSADDTPPKVPPGPDTDPSDGGSGSGSTGGD